MFWNNFYEMCHSIGKSPNALAKELNISSGAITSWKKGKVPHHNTLIKIADYFGVTVDYLLRDKSATSQDTISEEKKELLDYIANSNLNSEQIIEVHDYLRYILDKKKRKENNSQENK